MSVTVTDGVVQVVTITDECGAVTVTTSSEEVTVSESGVQGIPGEKGEDGTGASDYQEGIANNKDLDLGTGDIISSGAVIANINFPLADGIEDQVLKTNGNGQLSFKTLCNFEEIGLLLSTGLSMFDGLSTNVDNTKFNVGAIVAYIVDNYTDPQNPVVVKVVRSATVGESTPFINTANITHVGVDSDGELMYRDVPFTNEEHRRFAILGVVAHVDRLVIGRTVNRPVVLQSPLSQLHDLIRALEEIRSSGLKYSANGVNLKLNRSAGELIGVGLHSTMSPISPDNPNELKLPAEVEVTDMLYVLSDGSNFPIVGDNLDPNQIESPLGVLSAVSNNRFTIQYMVSFAEGRTNIQFGQTQYATLVGAKEAIENEVYKVADIIADNAIILAAIILKKGATDLSDTTEVFIKNFGKFGGNI